MNRRAAQAIGVVVAAGALFLQAIVAGGVASEEMGIVMSAMRSLRRSQHLCYEMTSLNGEEEMVQKIWADLLMENWVEELAIYDADGMVVSFKRYFDGRQEWLNDGQGGWELTDSQAAMPGFDALTEFSLRVNDIRDTEYAEEGGRLKITFWLTDDLLEKRKQDLLSMIEADDSGTALQEASYQQYANASFENASITYVVDAEGMLAEIHFLIDVTQPELLLKGGGNYVLGEDVTYQTGYTAKVLYGNDTEVAETIQGCEAEVSAIR